MQIKIYNTYKFNELSEEAKQSAFDYIRNNWHDLGQHVVEEVVDSLKALEKAVRGDLDYSISIVPDRGEYIRITDYDKQALKELNKKKDDCPLTGVCYDYDVIQSLVNGDIEEVLNTIHKEGEYIYSDEGLTDMIEANDYDFLEDGTID